MSKMKAGILLAVVVFGLMAGAATGPIGVAGNWAEAQEKHKHSWSPANPHFPYITNAQGKREQVTCAREKCTCGANRCSVKVKHDPNE